MAHHFHMRLREARGPVGRAWVWVRTIGDLLTEGVSEALSANAAHKGGAGVPDGREGTRSDGGGGILGGLVLDLHFAGRTLRRNPSFTLIAAFTLALGIGATTVAFSLVKGVLLRPLPFPSDQELVVIREHRLDGDVQTLSFPNFDDFRNQSRSFEGIAALRFAAESTILGGAEPARGIILPVSREFFSVLGVMPFLGRPILPEENRPGGDAVAVVGYEFWGRALGAKETLEELRITVSGSSYAVVGVMPPGFKVLEDADVYLPLEHDAFMVRSSSNYRGIGRLAEGGTLDQAQVELDGISARLREAYPEETELSGVAMRPLREEVLGDLTRPLFLLLGASGLLLLLACTNVASTLMARSVRRRREMAIRTALGGGKARLARLVFTESLLLAALSGLGGVGLTLATLRVLKTAGAGLIPRLATVAVDGPVLAFALGATLLTSVLFGLLPAFRLPEPSLTLRSGSGGNTQRRSGLGWNFLVGGQVALAVSLVVASGLLLRSMREILTADTHFRSEGVLTLALDFSAAGLNSTDERAGTLHELKTQLSSIPGVTDMGFGSYLPAVRDHDDRRGVPAPLASRGASGSRGPGGGVASGGRGLFSGHGNSTPRGEILLRGRRSRFLPGHHPERPPGPSPLPRGESRGLRRPIRALLGEYRSGGGGCGGRGPGLAGP